MEYFYKISQSEAEQISKFEYAPCQYFDALAAPQNDGTYLISAELARNISDTGKFDSIDFDTYPIIKAEQNDPVIVDIFNSVKTKGSSQSTSLSLVDQTPLSGYWEQDVDMKWHFIETEPVVQLMRSAAKTPEIESDGIAKKSLSLGKQKTMAQKYTFKDVLFGVTENWVYFFMLLFAWIAAAIAWAFYDTSLGWVSLFFFAIWLIHIKFGILKQVKEWNNGTSS